MTVNDMAAGATNDRIGTELVLETDAMRVWRLRLAPGERIAAHRHDRPYFWTVLTSGSAVSHYGDGRVVDIVYHAGQTQHFPDLTPGDGFVHDLANTGDTDLVFVTTEFQTQEQTP